MAGVELRGHAVELDALAGRGLVEEVERAVGERAVGEVPLGEPDGLADGRVADLHAVVGLVAGRDPPQDLDGLVGRRGLDREDAEAAQEGRVLLLYLAQALGGGRGQEAHLTAREHRLQQVSDAASRRALAEERVEATDVEDRLTRPGGPHVRERAPEALLDFAAELRAGR